MRTYTQFLSKLADGKPLVGVEVGVFLGVNALNFLESLNIKHLYLIDPYYESDTIRNAARQRLSKYESKITWIYEPSIKAVKNLPDNLDFVYLDGDHTYPAVHQEIRLYFSKVKEGGILGGHDYLSVPNSSVKQAVDEFFANQRCGIEAACYLPVAGIMGRPDKATSYADNWLIIKPFSCNFYWGNINEFRQMHLWTAATLKSVSKSAQIKVYYKPNIKKTEYWEQLSDYAELIEFSEEMCGDLVSYYHKAKKQINSSHHSLVNIIREILSFHNGGLVFDFDILFLKDITSLAWYPNYYIWQDKNKTLIGGGFFKCERHNEVLLEILHEQTKLCEENYRFLSFMTIFSNIIKNGKDYNILPYTTFFPFPPIRWIDIFARDYDMPLETFGAHWWNQLVPKSITKRMDKPIYARNFISRIIHEKLGVNIIDNFD